MGRFLLWVAAITAITGAAFACVGGAWMAWMALSGVLSFAPDMRGFEGPYLFAGALTTSYLVVQLAPVSLNRVRAATAEYHDRTSKILGGLWATYHHLLAVAFLALPVALVWPVPLAFYKKWQRDRRSAAAVRREIADDQQTRELRAKIRSERDHDSEGWPD